jgi:Flp pilus assembly protein TadD
MTMNRTAFFKFAASSFILGATMAGCATTGPGTHGAAGAGQADKLAASAQQALAQDEGAKAVLSAEAAVATSPNDPQYRALLGQAYLSQGRFASAEAAFEDALTLGQADARTVIGLAMVRTASGRTSAARDLLAEHMDVVPATDYGLAMALAGDTEEGLRILWAEARQPGASAKVRQNLAYTLALAGRWRDAKLIASQDLSPAEAGKRVGEWAVLARPGAKAQQVAQLMGVTPRADPGLPVALALNAAPAPVEMAAAPELVPPAYTAAPTPIEHFAEVAPAVQPVRPAFAMIQPIPAAATHSTSQKVSVRPVKAGGYVVQLGAFSSAEGADQAWRKISSQYRNVRNFGSIANKAQVRGQIFHRIAVSGFESLNEAKGLCASLKAKGSQCFVRRIDEEAATRWVSRDKGQLSTRGT